jgi:glycerol uptake facilitator-like aquaporin
MGVVPVSAIWMYLVACFLGGAVAALVYKQVADSDS